MERPTWKRSTSRAGTATAVARTDTLKLVVASAEPPAIGLTATVGDDGFAHLSWDKYTGDGFQKYVIARVETGTAQSVERDRDDHRRQHDKLGRQIGPARSQVLLPGPGVVVQRGRPGPVARDQGEDPGSGNAVPDYSSHCGALVFERKLEGHPRARSTAPGGERINQRAG